jgi:hypothetical protein
MILGFAVWGDVPTPGLLVGYAIEGRLRDAARGMVYDCICEGEDSASRLLDRAVPEGWTAEMVLTVLLIMGGDLRRTYCGSAAYDNCPESSALIRSSSTTCLPRPDIHRHGLAWHHGKGAGSAIPVRPRANSHLASRYFGVASAITYPLVI